MPTGNQKIFVKQGIYYKETEISSYNPSNRSSIFYRFINHACTQLIGISSILKIDNNRS